MKNFWAKALVVSGGFILAMTLHILTQCEDSFNLGTDPGNDPELIDIKGMRDGAKNAEKAFLSGNPEEVRLLLSDDSEKFYGEQVSNLSEEILKAMGEALRSRELIVKSSTYAEFEFVDQGKTFTIAFTLADEDTWKIIRF